MTLGRGRLDEAHCELRRNELRVLRLRNPTLYGHTKQIGGISGSKRFSIVFQMHLNWKASKRNAISVLN